MYNIPWSTNALFRDTDRAKIWKRGSPMDGLTGVDARYAEMLWYLKILIICHSSHMADTEHTSMQGERRHRHMPPTPRQSSPTIWRCWLCSAVGIKAVDSCSWGQSAPDCRGGHIGGEIWLIILLLQNLVRSIFSSHEFGKVWARNQGRRKVLVATFKNF